MTEPPFRAEHVGSLLRPARLRTAHRDRAAGKINPDEFRRIQDDAIRDAVALQERLGFKLATDGEFRRASYWSHFLEAVEGMTVKPSPFRFSDAAGHESEFLAPHVTGKVRRKHSISGEEFRFLTSVARAMPKVTIPSAPTMHLYGGSKAVDRTAYPTDDAYYADLARIFRDEFAELAAQGCRYVQIDEVPLAMLCDATVRAKVQAGGWDPARLVREYVKLLNDCMESRPAGMTFGMHLCRGNLRGTWLSSGGYEYVAEQMFGGVTVDAFFLEFDSARAGDFTPLRFVPKDKRVVLGLISTKTPVLEKPDQLARRIDDAARFVDLDRLSISPQCGFASTVAGNPVTFEDEVKKLELVVETARTVWGSA